MDIVADQQKLPADVDAQPIVQAVRRMHPMLRELYPQIEAEQRFPPALVEQLRAIGCYRMTIPRSLGGLEVDPLTYLRVVEVLAEGAGSVGWNLANNSIAQLVTLGLPEDGVQEIHGQNGPSIIAGTAVQGGGQAVPVTGGYRVTGHWTFGTGCQEASWMLGSFQVLDDGEPRRDANGKPLFWRGVFPRDAVEVVPGSWDVAGLRGTGSFDWKVTDLFLPEHRSMPHLGVPVDNQWSHWPGLTYALPSVCWVGPHHSAVISGIARAGIEAMIVLAAEKSPRGRSGMLGENPQVQEAIGLADVTLNAARSYRSAMITELWNTLAAGHETTLDQRARCRLAATYAGQSARAAMELVFRFGGSTGFKRQTRLAECWRDLHVVGQTVTISPEWYPIAGRALMGMDPGSRLH